MFPPLLSVRCAVWPFTILKRDSSSMSVTYFKRYRMEVDLTRRVFDQVPLPLGYRLVAWSNDLLDAHAEAKYLSFHGGIDADIFQSLGAADGCYDLMQGITSGSGFVPEATWLLESIDQLGQREPCGTIQGVRFDPQYGAIQNVGVAAYHRGKGLGAALVQAALMGFQQVGLRRAYLEVTVRNKSAVRLYQRLGFRRTKTIFKSVELAY